MLGAIALGIPLSAIGAIYPTNTWLQVGPVALLLPLAVLALRRYPIGNRSAGCIAGFVLLHLFAARWSYSFVPYDTWLGGIDSTLGFQRNMFDRLAHFLFGLLAIAGRVELPVAAGYLLAVVGMAEMLVVPLILSRKWKSPKP